MRMLDWIVIAGGIAAIVWVNWYFLAVNRNRRVGVQNGGPPLESTRT